MFQSQFNNLVDKLLLFVFTFMHVERFRSTDSFFDYLVFLI